MTGRFRHDAIDALALGAVPVTPSPALRARVLASAQSLRIVPRDAGRWRSLAPGLDYKRLAGRPGDRTRSMLLRLAPGATLPAHVHDVDEHLLVVSGAFEQDGRRATTGDYIHSPRGSAHTEAETAWGCVVLVVQVETNPIQHDDS